MLATPSECEWQTSFPFVVCMCLWPVPLFQMMGMLDKPMNRQESTVSASQFGCTPKEQKVYTEAGLYGFTAESYSP